MTTQPVASASRRERRRNATPLDPRRSPEALASGLLPAADPAHPAALEPEAAETAASLLKPGEPQGGIARGVAILRAALRNVPSTPGVYRMLDRKGDALYVGKARNLKSRVQNYTHPAGLSNRIRRMVAETAAFEVVGTATEAEALLLECNLIKRLMPRYNVLLRDDKSFPFIHLTAGHDFPQLTKFRGARDKAGRVFRAVRLGRRGQPHLDRVAEGVSAALVQRQRVQQPHPSLPAVPDQALQRALRRPDRQRRVRAADRAGAAVSVRAQQRDPAAARGRDGPGRRGARFRGRGVDPRPHPRAVAGAGTPGYPRRRPRRRRCHRGASGRRSYLRAGLLLPRRA